MKPTLKACLDFLSEDEWNPLVLPSEAQVRVRFGGNSGRFTCIARALDQSHGLEFSTYLPFFVPLTRRAAAFELLALINDRLVCGHMDMDIRDGELRARTTLMVGAGTALHAPMVKSMIYAAVLTADRYHPAFQALVLEGVSASSAYERAS